MKTQLKNSNFFIKKDLLILSLLSLGLFFNSCHCEDEGTYFVDEDFKAYTIFPVDSWWVYENISTKEQDTAKVLTSESQWIGNGHCDIEKELITQRIVRHGKDWRIYARTSPFSDDIESSYLEEELNSQNRVSQFFRLLFPLTYTESGSSEIFHAHETLDSTEIAGQIFYDIIETRLGNQRTVFSREVGIIAITYEDGSSYVLKDYFIEE